MAPVGREARDQLLDELAVLAKTDRRALSDLVVRQEPLVEYVIRRHARRSLGRHIVPDLRQEGRKGVMRAVETYGLSVGHFATYCYLWIRCYVGRYARRYTEVVNAFHASRGGCHLAWATVISIDSSSRQSADVAGEDRTLAEVLADESDLDEEVQEHSRREACQRLAALLLQRLPPMERMILCYRFAGGASCRTIAEEFATVRGTFHEGRQGRRDGTPWTRTHQGVQQAEDRALAHLRQLLHPDPERETFDQFLLRTYRILSAQARTLKEHHVPSQPWLPAHPRQPARLRAGILQRRRRRARARPPGPGGGLRGFDCLRTAAPARADDPLRGAAPGTPPAPPAGGDPAGRETATVRRPRQHDPSGEHVSDVIRQGILSHLERRPLGVALVSLLGEYDEALHGVVRVVIDVLVKQGVITSYVDAENSLRLYVTKANLDVMRKAVAGAAGNQATWRADVALETLLQAHPLGLSMEGILRNVDETHHDEVRAVVHKAELEDRVDWYTSNDDPPVRVYVAKEPAAVEQATRVLRGEVVDWSLYAPRVIFEALKSAPKIAGPWERGQRLAPDGTAVAWEHDGMVWAQTLRLDRDASATQAVGYATRAGVDSDLRKAGWVLVES